MSGLGTLPTALTLVFALCLAILIGELLYVLWRRRRFWQRSVTGGGDTPSKELLYFFCWKNQSRIEPAAAAAAAPPEEEEEDDVTKWQVYGPSRVLFTIKEEEKEELESENSCFEEIEAKRVCSKEDHQQVAAVVEVDVEADEATPFSTPCESPPYYTPSPSPRREKDDDASFVSVQIHDT